MAKKLFFYCCASVIVLGAIAANLNTASAS